MIIAFIEAYFDLIAKILNKLKIDFSASGINISAKDEEANIDERINKIDIAKKNLTDVINAIDELKKEAQDNKEKSALALRELAKLEENKANLNQEITAIKTVINSNIEGFRIVAGIPNKNKERAIGFISGIIASLIASGLIFGLTKLIGFIVKST